jgi:hypothetical protein
MKLCYNQHINRFKGRKSVQNQQNFQKGACIMILDNSKSAKEYISEAYTKELTLIQEKARLLETPASIIEKEKTEKTFQMVEALLGREILSEDVTSEYSELLTAIEAKKEELKKLYGIEVSEGALQAVKNAQKSVSEQFTEELQQKEKDFQEELQKAEDKVQEEIDTKTAETDEKVEAIKKEAKETRAAAEQEAKREKEQYDYDLKRARKQADEERAKVVAEREKALQEKEQAAQEAKQACLDKLAEIEALSVKVEGIPAELESAKAEGAAAKEKELKKDYGYHKWMADKENDTKISELKDELVALQKKYQELCKEKEALSAKLDKVNAESRQLTSDTVKSIGGINILNSDTYNGQGKK